MAAIQQIELHFGAEHCAELETSCNMMEHKLRLREIFR